MYIKISNSKTGREVLNIIRTVVFHRVFCKLVCQGTSPFSSLCVSI